MAHVVERYPYYRWVCFSLTTPTAESKASWVELRATQACISELGTPEPSSSLNRVLNSLIKFALQSLVQFVALASSQTSLYSCSSQSSTQTWYYILSFIFVCLCVCILNLCLRFKPMYGLLYDLKSNTFLSWILKVIALYWKYVSLSLWTNVMVVVHEWAWIYFGLTVPSCMTF